MGSAAIDAPGGARLSFSSRLAGLWLAALLLLALTLASSPRVIGFDSHAFWSAWHRHSLYGGSPGTQDAYLYSPAFAQLVWPLAQLPWPVFLAVWTTVGFVAYAWLLWPIAPAQRVPMLLICVPQAVVGNIWPFFALVAVFGFRRPGLWAFPLLTKVTAATGFVWFFVRREWCALRTAVALSLLVTATSVAIGPGLWRSWLHLLATGGNGGTAAGAPNVPLLWRLPVALLIAVFAARRNRPRLFVVTIGLASPVFAASWLLSNLAVLAALPRMPGALVVAGEVDAEREREDRCREHHAPPLRMELRDPFPPSLDAEDEHRERIQRRGDQSDRNAAGDDDREPEPTHARSVGSAGPSSSRRKRNRAAAQAGDQHQHSGDDRGARK